MVVVVVLLQGKGDRAAAIIRYTHPATTRALFCSSLKFTVEHFCLCVPHASMIYCCSPSSGGEMCWRRSRVAQNNMLPSTRLRLYHAQMPGVTVPPPPFASSPPGAPSPESSPQERKPDLLFVLLLQPKCQTLGLTRGVGASDDLLLARPLFYSLPSLCGHWTGYRRQATSSTESHMPFGQLVPNAAQPYLARPRSPDADLPDYDMMYL